jgi:hypothetical protein
MENLNCIQLVLPLDLQGKPDYKDIVKQNWKFTFSRQVMSSVYTKRVIGLIVAQIKEEGYKEYFQIPAADIIKEAGIDHAAVYRNMKDVAQELRSISFDFEDEKHGTYIPRHLVDTTRFKNPTGYYNGVLTVAFNPILKDIIMELAHYSEYELSAYMKFSSWYSMRLFEMLSAYRDTGWMERSIDKYRDLMGCGAGSVFDRKGKPKINKKTGKEVVKYPNSADLIKYTTREALKELANTDCAFVVLPVYDKTKSGKGRRPIIAVRFDLKSTTIRMKDSELIEKWCRERDDFKRVFERLKEYKVYDNLIVKYTAIIGMKGLNTLLHEWDLKQKSNDPIKIKEHYCNKALADCGKAIEVEKTN